ncbi:MAG: SDR family oxidoreductase [Gammaproteobacteria bacterium]|nr:SDR family oxidoreductase [Gammaproteobacteria bacterium]
MKIPGRTFGRIALLGLVASALLACSATGERPESPPAPAKPTVLITGASRGIGLELARQYAERGWGVIATARNPQQSPGLVALAASRPNVVLEILDVTDPGAIEALARRYAGVPIDVLINNAGLLGDNDKQKFGSFDYAAFDAVMDTNAKGPTRMTEAFIDHVAASEQKKLMNISSLVGSISFTFGGQTFYRASKASLNMIMRNLSKEMRRAPVEARRAVIFGLIDPGVVDTGFAKNVPIPMITAAESAAGVIRVIDEFTLENSGNFIDYRGRKLPW